MTKELATVILGLCVVVITVFAIAMARLMNVDSLGKEDRARIYDEYGRASTWDKRLLVFVVVILRVLLASYWGVVTAAVTALGAMAAALNGWFELDKLRPLLNDFYDFVLNLIREIRGQRSVAASIMILKEATTPGYRYAS